METKTLGIVGGVTAALFLLPKVASYFSTRPTKVETRVDHLRSTLANVQEAAEKEIGKEGWVVVKEVFAKHAWISFLVLSILVDHSKKPIGEMKMAVVSQFVALTALLGSFHYGVNEFFTYLNDDKS